MIAIKLVDARRELNIKCRELFQDEKIAESIYRYLCDGIEECDNVEPELKVGEWIPVTDRLPEHEYGESTSVLTVDLFGVMRVAYFDGGNWCCPSGEALTTMQVAPITHWMPLPEPPKEVDDEGLRKL